MIRGLSTQRIAIAEEYLAGGYSRDLSYGEKNAMFNLLRLYFESNLLKKDIKNIGYTLDSVRTSGSLLIFGLLKDKKAPPFKKDKVEQDFKTSLEECLNYAMPQEPRPVTIKDFNVVYREKPPKVVINYNEKQEIISKAVLYAYGNAVLPLWTGVH